MNMFIELIALRFRLIKINNLHCNNKLGTFIAHDRR